MDADFSHPVHTIPALIAACEHCDVAIASRYVPGGGVLGWSFGRKVMSRLINMWARMLLGLTCRDNSGSFRCYRMQLLRRIDWSKAIARGYAIPEEVLFRRKCHSFSMTDATESPRSTFAKACRLS
jgi:dolichol-phosphate mannosyltransferase